MHNNLFGRGRRFLSASANRARLRQAILGSVCLAVFLVSGQAKAAGPATPAACKALQAKYPQLKGKTLVNAINPHTPGYEALDPNDPSKYIGFDIDNEFVVGYGLDYAERYREMPYIGVLRPAVYART